VNNVRSEAHTEAFRMFKIVIAVVLLAHGIGHVLGPLQVSKVAVVNPSWNGDSWLLTGAVGQSITGAVGVALWTVAIVAFGVLAGVAMGWLPEAWWTPLAIVASVVSLVAVLLFPAALPATSTIGAVIVDVVVLAAVLWFHWVPSSLPE
jgi:hypothetical protein